MLGCLLIDVLLVHLGTTVLDQVSNNRFVELITSDVKWSVTLVVLWRHFAVLFSHQELDERQITKLGSEM